MALVLNFGGESSSLFSRLHLAFEGVIGYAVSSKILVLLHRLLVLELGQGK